MVTHARITFAAAAFLMLFACVSPPASREPKAAAAASPPCLTQSGARIDVDEWHCRAIGRSYTQEDISRTGATSTGEALRLLDPSITVHQ